MRWPLACNSGWVMCQLQNCRAMLQAMFAVWRAGAVWVPANFRQTAEGSAWLTQPSGARLLLCKAGFADHASACRAGCDGLQVLCYGASGFAPLVKALTGEFLGQRPQVAVAERDEPCWFFFTFGATGRPKASVLTHGQVAFAVTNHLADLTSADAFLVVAPLSHSAGVHQLTQIVRIATGVHGRLAPRRAISALPRHLDS
ncbi:AMP-binding protein [Fertoeibacter niger]|uniref:AMP-binding protein n=1 Tax=Fertoeibacter niger TaxID=2656921 RepID=UPI001F4C6CCF|nr:AMP-binding protein [Fertoeibacter niger]